MHPASSSDRHAVIDSATATTVAIRSRPRSRTRCAILRRPRQTSLCLRQQYPPRGTVKFSGLGQPSPHEPIGHSLQTTPISVRHHLACQYHRLYAAFRRRVASARSKVACRFIHSRGEVPSASARSSAASAVTPRFPLMNSLSRAFVQPVLSAQRQAFSVSGQNCPTDRGMPMQPVSFKRHRSRRTSSGWPSGSTSGSPSASGMSRRCWRSAASRPATRRSAAGP